MFTLLERDSYWDTGKLTGQGKDRRVLAGFFTTFVLQGEWNRPEKVCKGGIVCKRRQGQTRIWL